MYDKSRLLWPWPQPSLQFQNTCKTKQWYETDWNKSHLYKVLRHEQGVFNGVTCEMTFSLPTFSLPMPDFSAFSKAILHYSLPPPFAKHFIITIKPQHTSNILCQSLKSSFLVLCWKSWRKYESNGGICKCRPVSIQWSKMTWKPERQDCWLHNPITGCSKNSEENKWVGAIIWNIGTWSKEWIY